MALLITNMIVPPNPQFTGEKDNLGGVTQNLKSKFIT